MSQFLKRVLFLLWFTNAVTVISRITWFINWDTFTWNKLIVYQFSIVKSPSKPLADFFAVFAPISIWFWILTICVIFFALTLHSKINRKVFKLSFKVCSFDTKQNVLYKMKPSRTDKLSCVTVLMVKMRSVGLAWVALQHPRSW